MQLESKAMCYRKLRNFICGEIAKTHGIYENTKPENMAARKECLDETAFYKDCLTLLTNYKEVLCDG